MVFPKRVSLFTVLLGCNLQANPNHIKNNQINNIIKLELLPPALIPRIRQGEMPLDTVLCLDTSGSMGWNNNEGINQLKAAALKFLDGVQETAAQADLKVT